MNEIDKKILSILSVMKHKIPSQSLLNSINLFCE